MSERNEATVGRVVTLVAAAVVLTTSIRSNVIRVASGIYEDPLLQVLLCAVELGITGLLCWGLVRGRPWARWITVARSGLAIALVGPKAFAVPLVQGFFPNVVVAYVWVPLAIAVLLLLFGPGVGAFFRQGSRREREQDAYLSEVEQSSESVDAGTEIPRVDQELVRLVRDFEREVEQLGLEAFYRSDTGCTAAGVVDALRDIGASEAARVVGEANDLFAEGRPPDPREERCRALDSMSRAQRSTLARLELELERHGEDLDPLLYEYVRNASPSPKESGEWSSSGAPRVSRDRSSLSK